MGGFRLELFDTAKKNERKKKGKRKRARGYIVALLVPVICSYTSKA